MDTRAKVVLVERRSTAIGRNTNEITRVKVVRQFWTHPKTVLMVSVAQISILVQETRPFFVPLKAVIRHSRRHFDPKQVKQTSWSPGTKTDAPVASEVNVVRLIPAQEFLFRTYAQWNGGRCTNA